MVLFIKVGSITNAQRGLALLRNAGYKPQIKRIQNPTDSDGCGYAIEVNSKNEEPLIILKNRGINIRGVEKP